jgi:hypothetical protein
MIVAAIADRYPETKTIFAKNKWIGGNLYYLNRGWAVTIPGKNPDMLKGQVILVWPSDRAAIPRNMTDYLTAQHKQIVSFDPTTTVKVAFSTESESKFTMSFTAAQLN